VTAIPLVPNQNCDVARIRGGLQTALPEQKSAMAAALAQIEVAFGHAAAIHSFKLRVDRSLRLGPQHGAVRARFGARAALLSSASLDTAIVIAERWWRDERKAFQIASALGYGTRLSLEILRELRLVLRLMRFKRMHAEFGAIVAALRSEAIAAAAE
jgi:hypothetical protein